MRITILRSLVLASLGLVFAADARAQDATRASTSLERAGAQFTDATGEGGAADEGDAVGSAGTAPAFIGSDATYLYFRVRVNGNPIGGGSNFKQQSYACAIDTNGTLTSLEYLAGLRGGSGATVEWRFNTTPTADSTSDQAESLLSSVAASSTQATLVSGTQYFVTWWVPWSVIRGGSNPIAAGTPMRFACGTSTNNALNIGRDPIAGNVVAPTLSATWSTPYVCGDSGCVLDTDGDGIPDDVETGTTETEPLLADSDGDGFPDNVEASASGLAGPFVRIDTDGDGVVDGKDADSDNDCLSDAVERAGGTNPRLATAPQANASLNCAAAAAPICLTTTGQCVACDANFSGGTAASCFASTAPACHLGGALQGRCTQCKAGLTSQCAGATPACEDATGACAACNGDNGEAAKSSVCPDPAAPACQKVGAPAGILGRCTVCSPTNASLCSGATPACDPASGACAACDGDRSGGTTKGCPNAANPYCLLAGGTCGKCTSNADCGTGHAGPTCDLPTGACVDKDSDGDGLNDSVEKLLGTDFLKTDTDGDGLDDMTEVTAIAGGPPSKIDTDGDGTIDALDDDSDGDGITDAVEGKGDVDSDGTPNFRDPDDDGDGITTKNEIAIAEAAKVSDDVDGDGKKNYYDADADGDGKGDAFEGTGDEDADAIPNFLDPDDKTTKPFDAGAPIAPTPPATTNPGAPTPGGPPPAEDGAVVEGSGFACSAATGRSSGLVLVALAGLALAAARRRRMR